MAGLAGSTKKQLDSDEISEFDASYDMTNMETNETILAQCYADLALCLAKQNKNDEAIRNYNFALEICEPEFNNYFLPISHQAWEGLMNIYNKRGEYLQARKACKETLSIIYLSFREESDEYKDCEKKLQDIEDKIAKQE